MAASPRYDVVEMVEDVLASAARALRRGDPIEVLALTTGATSAPALALRGAALAQLEEHRDAVRCLTAAARGAASTGDRDTETRANLALAELEVARRDLDAALTRLDGCRDALFHQPENGALAALLGARIELFRGRADAARARLARARAEHDPFLGALIELAHAEVDLARGDAEGCIARLRSARELAGESRHGFLLAEIEAGIARLNAPRARLVGPAGAIDVNALELSRLRASPPDTLIDALSSRISAGKSVVDLSKRPQLFALLYCLARRAPEPATREELVMSLGARKVNEAHLATLRVELGRLRRLLPAGVRIAAGPREAPYRLETDRRLSMLEPLDGTEDHGLMALLSDGEAWKTDDLASALGVPKRTVQRRIGALRDAGKVVGVGSGKSARWTSASAAAFTIVAQLTLLFGSRGPAILG